MHNFTKTFVAGLTGLEPATYAQTMQRSPVELQTPKID